MHRGHVYILINACMRGYLKIGQTARTPEERARELSAVTGVPVPFEVAYAEELYYFEEAEREVHARLEQFRVNDKREFFVLSTREAIEIVREVVSKWRRKEEAEAAAKVEAGRERQAREAAAEVEAGRERDPGEELAILMGEADAAAKVEAGREPHAREAATEKQVSVPVDNPKGPSGRVPWTNPEVELFQFRALLADVWKNVRAKKRGDLEVQLQVIANNARGFHQRIKSDPMLLVLDVRQLAQEVNKIEEQLEADPPLRGPRLLVLRGQKRNVEYPIKQGKNIIGRADGTSVDIDLENQELPDHVFCSRQHACLTFAVDQLTIEDLNSSNGTYVNRARVTPGQTCTLTVNDIIQISNIQLKVVV
jgi:hypothetical protein